MANDRISGMATGLVGTATNAGAISISKIKSWSVEADAELLEDTEDGARVPIYYEGKDSASVTVESKDYGSLALLEKGDYVSNLILTVKGCKLSDGTVIGGTATFTFSQCVVESDGRSISGSADDRTPLQGSITFKLANKPGDETDATFAQAWSA